MLHFQSFSNTVLIKNSTFWTKIGLYLVGKYTKVIICIERDYPQTTFNIPILFHTCQFPYIKLVTTGGNENGNEPPFFWMLACEELVSLLTPRGSSFDLALRLIVFIFFSIPTREDESPCKQGSYSCTKYSGISQENHIFTTFANTEDYVKIVFHSKILLLEPFFVNCKMKMAFKSNLFLVVFQY